LLIGERSAPSKKVKVYVDGDIEAQLNTQQKGSDVLYGQAGNDTLEGSA
jgi:RTX calcium-binding nonapeptide repeat (4 copies)